MTASKERFFGRSTYVERRIVAETRSSHKACHSDLLCICNSLVPALCHQENVQHPRAKLRQPKIGLIACPSPWAPFIVHAFKIRGCYRRWCEVLLPCSYPKRVKSLRVGCRPQTPHWSAADSSLLDVSPELRRLEVVFRSHRDYRRGCSVSLGALVKENGLMLERDPRSSFWGFRGTFRSRRTTETIYLPDGSPRTL